MQRDLSDSDASNRILRHESALHSTSLASEFQCGETANNGAAENCSARHGRCYSRSWPSRAVVALSHVRGLLLRSTLAATAPRSAVSELESRCSPLPVKKAKKILLGLAATVIVLAVGYAIF